MKEKILMEELMIGNKLNNHCSFDNLKLQGNDGEDTQNDFEDEDAEDWEDEYEDVADDDDYDDDMDKEDFDGSDDEEDLSKEEDWTEDDWN